jgi:hypothetical protein
VTSRRGKRQKSVNPISYNKNCQYPSRFRIVSILAIMTRALITQLWLRPYSTAICSVDAKINAKLVELKRALFDSFVDLYNHSGEYRRLGISTDFVPTSRL